MSSDARAMVIPAGTDVDIDGLLRLGQQAAGQTGKGVGDAEADNGRKDGVDRRGSDHIRVIARGADGKAQLRLQKQAQEDGDENHRDGGDDELNCRPRPCRQKTFIFVKTVTVLFILRTEELPMMAMLIE